MSSTPDYQPFSSLQAAMLRGSLGGEVRRTCRAGGNRFSGGPLHGPCHFGLDGHRGTHDSATDGFRDPRSRAFGSSHDRRRNSSPHGAGHPRIMGNVALEGPVESPSAGLRPAMAGGLVAGSPQADMDLSPCVARRTLDHENPPRVSSAAIRRRKNQATLSKRFGPPPPPLKCDGSGIPPSRLCQNGSRPTGVSRRPGESPRPRASQPGARGGGPHRVSRASDEGHLSHSFDLGVGSSGRLCGGSRTSSPLGRSAPVRRDPGRRDFS